MNQLSEKIKQARNAAAMTQTEAAQIVYCTLRTWQNYESGNKAVPMAIYELFLLKTRLAVLSRGTKLPELVSATFISTLKEPK